MNAECLFELHRILLAKGLSENDADMIFYTNAGDFFRANNIEY